MPPGFSTTSWTLIRIAAGNPTPDSREALAALCQKYWHPVYVFIRRRGYARDESEDLTQGFFALLIERNYLLDADSKRGRFRSFLLGAVQHFLANEWDRENAVKRGGGQVAVCIDNMAEAEVWHAPRPGGPAGAARFPCCSVRSQPRDDRSRMPPAPVRP